MQKKLYKYCRYGGEEGKGHPVPEEKMTKLAFGGKTYHICEDCKPIKLAKLKEEHKRVVEFQYYEW